MATRQQKMSRMQERRAAEDIGGRVQKGSGSHWSAKGDVRQHGKLRMECKVTEAQVYRLRLAQILKIQKEALRGMDADWAFQIQFKGFLGSRFSYAICDRALWNQWGGNMANQATTMYTATSKTFLFRRDDLREAGPIAFDWINGDRVLHFAVVPWETYCAVREEVA